MQFDLKEYRMKRDVTQEEVAKECGIKRSYYSMIETGKRTPSVSVAKRLAEYFDFNWTLFFTQ